MRKATRKACLICASLALQVQLYSLACLARRCRSALFVAQKFWFPNPMNVNLIDKRTSIKGDSQEKWPSFAVFLWPEELQCLPFLVSTWTTIAESNLESKPGQTGTVCLCVPVTVCRILKWRSVRRTHSLWRNNEREPGNAPPKLRGCKKRFQCRSIAIQSPQFKRWILSLYSFHAVFMQKHEFNPIFECNV